MNLELRQAIGESANQNKIVCLTALGTLQAELLEACDDYAETADEEGKLLLEFWGEDEDGNPWRIHLRGASAF